MKVSIFQSLSDPVPRVSDTTWERFMTAIRNPKVRAGKDGQLWSPTIFSGNRSKENAVETSMLVLDFDGGSTINAEWSAIRESGYQAALYTTHSHQRVTDSHVTPTDCFRIVLPLSSPIPALQYPLLWKWAWEFTEGKIDRAAKDVSRIYFVPVKASESAVYEYREQEGELLDWRELDLSRYEEKVVATPVTVTGSNSYVTRAFESEIAAVLSAPKGERNDQLNRSAFALGQFVPHLLSESEVSDALEKAAKGSGLADSEIRGTIRSGLSEGQKTPRQIPEKPVPAIITITEEQQDEYVFDIGRCAEEMIRYREERAAREIVDTGWPELSSIYSPIKGSFTIVTGNPGHGKSAFLDNLVVNIYKRLNWKFALISFESQPIYMHMCVIASLVSGKPYSLHKDDNLSNDEIRRICNKLRGHFIFHLVPYEMRTVQVILNLLRKSLPFDGLVLDPFTELGSDAGTKENYLEFMRTALARIRAFTQDNEVTTWLVAHPQKEHIEARSKGRDRVINLQDITGGRYAEFIADFGLTVHRTNLGEADDTTSVYVTKVRNQMPGLHGHVNFQWTRPLGEYVVKPKDGLDMSGSKSWREDY